MCYPFFLFSNDINNSFLISAIKIFLGSCADFSKCFQAATHIKKSNRHSPLAQHVEVLKAEGVCEGQTFENCSLNSVSRLQTHKEKRKRGHLFSYSDARVML